MTTLEETAPSNLPRHDENKAVHTLPSQQPDDPDKPNFKYRLVNYKGTNLFADWATMMPEVEMFACKSDDVFLASFPKSGTTWMETIIRLILNHGDSRSIPVTDDWDLDTWRFPHIEARYTNVRLRSGNVTTVEFIGRARKSTSPRFIKTHLPYNLLPREASEKNCRVLYVYRDVRDVMVSLYHHYLNTPFKVHDMSNCTFPAFVHRFTDGQVESAPYFHHLGSYWQHRQKSNFFLISYEELKQDHSGSIRKIAKFLDVQLTDYEVELIRVHSSVEGMRAAKVSELSDSAKKLVPDNQFVRSGKTGSWRTHFTDDLTEHTEKWTARNMRDLNLDVNL